MVLYGKFDGTVAWGLMYSCYGSIYGKVEGDAGMSIYVWERLEDGNDSFLPCDVFVHQRY